MKIKLSVFWRLHMFLYESKHLYASNTRSYKLNSVVPSTLQTECFDE